MENKNLLGILMVIFGLVLMAFPFITETVLSVLAGISFLILGIYFIMSGVGVFDSSKISSILNIIFGIFSFILGLFLMGNIILFNFIASFYIIVFGVLYIISGLSGVFTRVTPFGRGSSIVLLILGILTIVLGYFALIDPIFIAIILGVGLIIDGVAFLFAKSPE
ncbi:MAG: DUF308 domain-containing protein [Methanobrevibacter sp.]|jgi:uncharacterized membrane protein HdeD (DUF308 family)|nr:DUF308 domain-containing protein [Candidatus Methanoflexus mossambicus]